MLMVYQCTARVGADCLLMVYQCTARVGADCLLMVYQCTAACQSRRTHSAGGCQGAGVSSS